MHVRCSLLALATTFTCGASALPSGSAARRGSSSSSAREVTITSNSLVVRSYGGGFPGYPPQGYVAPYVDYRVEVGYGDYYAFCDHTARDNLVFESDCGAGFNPALNPAVTGVATEPCQPADYNPLRNVSWSVTKYGDRYVVQLDLLDMDTGEPLVACDEFSKDQFMCDGYYEYYEGGLYGPNTRNLTASAGRVCPTY